VPEVPSNPRQLTGTIGEACGEARDRIGHALAQRCTPDEYGQERGIGPSHQHCRRCLRGPRRCSNFRWRHGGYRQTGALRTEARGAARSQLGRSTKEQLWVIRYRPSGAQNCFMSALPRKRPLAVRASSVAMGQEPRCRPCDRRVRSHPSPDVPGRVPPAPAPGPLADSCTGPNECARVAMTFVDRP
jgi:hypothetical protein